MLLFSELIWVILYVLSVIFGGINDDINLYSLSFFLLALAGLEFSIGVLLLVLFKNFKIDFNFFKNNIYNSIFNDKLKNYFFFNKFFFK